MLLISKMHKFLRFHFSSFRNKLIFGFFLIAIIPLVVISLLSYQLSFKIARDGILESVTYSSNQLNSSLANRFEQMEYAANAMQYYMYTLVLEPSHSITSQLDKYSYIKNNISNLNYTFHFVNINVYTRPDLLFSNQGINFFKLDELSGRGLSQADLQQQLNRMQWRLFPGQREPFVKSGSTASRDYLSVFNAFKKKASSQLEYVYFIDIDEREIARLLADSSPDPSVQTYIVDSSGYIVSHPDLTKLGTMIGTDMMHTVLNNPSSPVSFNKTQLIIHHNDISGWYVITEVPDTYIRHHTNVLVNILLVMILLVVMIALFASLFISNSLSSKVRRMAKVMSSFRLNDTHHQILELHMPVSTEKAYLDELDQLSLVFNSMIHRINDNFRTMLVMNLQEEKLKFQLLQSKINPHFLYNILESIKTCQSLGRIDEANAMITRLAKFYRLILKKGDELITIRDELEIAVLYLELEKVNHSRSLTWNIVQAEQSEHFLIPKFTLQPLIENSIRHGLRSGEVLDIQISVEYGDEDMIISVRDNGTGMPAAKLADIRTSLGRKNADTKRYYGINNVHKRLSLYSNGRSGLHIDSAEGHGTTVSVFFQQMLPDDEEF
ncbi:sensor histidine kinase [Paenibacillus terreus]